MVRSSGTYSSRRPVIGVMGGGETASESDKILAEELGKKIALNKWYLLTGGRDTGIMEAAARGAKKVPGSITIGILPDTSVHPSDYIDIPIISGIGEARNYINILSSRIVVACGEGGAGTSSEIALAIKVNKPLILLHPTGETITYFSKIQPDLIVTDRPDDVIRIIKHLLSV